MFCAIANTEHGKIPAKFYHKNLNSVWYAWYDGSEKSTGDFDIIVE